MRASLVLIMAAIDHIQLLRDKDAADGWNVDDLDQWLVEARHWVLDTERK